MDIKEIEILGDEINSHWYYTAKASAVLKIIEKQSIKNIMDVGAGSGYFAKALLNNTQASEAWCIDISYENDACILENDKPIHYLRSISNKDVDLVLLMDVLEHVDDDVGLLSEYVDKVPVGTKFLISVPAFDWLWSPHDDFLEHKRRYTINQIESVVKDAGLKIDNTCYYFSLVLPLAIITRLGAKINRSKKIPRSQLKKNGLIINTVLRMLCSLDKFFFQSNKIAGLTVFCYAEKI